MKFSKLISVLDIFCLMIRYSKDAFKQLFLLRFDKNCKIINQYYNILKAAQASQGLHRHVWRALVLVRIACVARIARRTLVNNYKSQITSGKFSKLIMLFLINVLGLIFETIDIRTSHHKIYSQGVLEHGNKFSTCENAKKLILNISNICRISEELKCKPEFYLNGFKVVHSRILLLYSFISKNVRGLSSLIFLL